MAFRHLPLRRLDLARAWLLTSSRKTPQLFHPVRTIYWTRAFSSHPIPSTSSITPTRNPASGANPVYPRDAAPPQVPEFENLEADSVRHAAFLGEADSNDAHEANRDAFAPPAPSLDASNSAYLGEADSDDDFEARRDAEDRPFDPVDVSQSAFLGEADSDDGFEGRRAAYPEEGDHGIIDASASGVHGQAGEGDGEIEQTRA